MYWKHRNIHAFCRLTITFASAEDLVFPLHPMTQMFVRSKLLFLALLLVSGLSFAEAPATHSEQGGGKAGQNSSALKKGSGTDDPCTVTRPVRSTRKEESTPISISLQKCLDNIPKGKAKEPICLTALGFCSAKTVDGGLTPVVPPIEVEFSCINNIDEAEVMRKACERGIDASRFKAGEIKCGPNKEDL